MTELWFDEDGEIPPLKQSEDHNSSRLARAYVMFLLTWQALFKVSDAGMNVLFRFISMLVRFMVSPLQINVLQSFMELLPNNILAAKKLVGSDTDLFAKYASCPGCDSIYDLDTCSIVQPDKTVCSRQCSFIKFPNHSQARQRAPCNAQLMKRVRTPAGTTSLYPRRMFCYQSLIDSMKLMLQRPGFAERCELWRKRKSAPNVLSDIYDGKIWKEFLDVDGVPFLSLPYNFALSLNVDWFQPFKHSTYSAGAIYIAIQNIPRNERYSTDNVILVGIIPGPHEPKKNMNSYLVPLVDELKKLWSGVIMQSASGVPVLVRSALVCTSCDIPASRKVSGFVGHSAYRACSRCLKPFPTERFGQKPDYTGTDRSSWPPRSLDVHRQQAIKHKNANTREKQKSIEREHGCRYSLLLELPYYDIIRCCVIDPMHNLLLGTAKHVLSIWMSKNIIEKSNLVSIQSKVDGFVTPTDIGRIPSKIASGFSSFTAEQWRNWVLIYSLCSLKDVLPHPHYDCWLLFVKAVSILCSRQITLQELNVADELLMDFCDTFEQLYGKPAYTINLHLHGHIRDCVLDFGPVYAFWLFAFERLNGVLGSYHTNCRDISLQLMRRFTSSVNHGVHNWPLEYKDSFSPLLSRHQYQMGSLQSASLEQALLHSETVQPLPPVREAAWMAHQKHAVRDLVSSNSVMGHNDFDLLTLYEKASALTVGGFVLGSSSSRYVTKAHVMAAHPKYPDKIYLAEVDHFAKLDIVTNRSHSKSTVTSIWTACVKFYYEHDHKQWFGGPTEVWTRSQSPDMYYISLCSVKSRVAYCETSVDFGTFIGEQTVYVVSILSNFSS